MILCFSGTGNSRYIAKKIAQALQDKVVDLNAKIKAADYSPIQTGENIIVVTPTYAWRIPRIVLKWLSKTKLVSAQRIWFVMDCGEIQSSSCRAKTLMLYGYSANCHAGKLYRHVQRAEGRRSEKNREGCGACHCGRYCLH